MSTVRNNSVVNTTLVYNSSNLAVVKYIEFGTLGKSLACSLDRQNEPTVIQTVDGDVLIDYPRGWHLLTVKLSGISPSVSAVRSLSTLLSLQSWVADMNGQFYLANPATPTFLRLKKVAFLKCDKPIGDIQAGGVGEITATFAVGEVLDSGLTRVADVVRAITGGLA